MSNSTEHAALREYFSKLADFLLRDLRSGDAERVRGALLRIHRARPDLALWGTAEAPERMRLGDALDAVAFEQGHAHWRHLMAPPEPMQISSMARDELVPFTRRLAAMHDAGLRIEHALRVLAAEPYLATLAPVAAALARHLQEGLSLPEALALYPSVFDPFYIAMVSNGLQSGSPGSALWNICKVIEREF